MFFPILNISSIPELLLNTVHAYHSAALLPRQETLETSISLVFRWSIIISQFPPVIFTFVFPENSPHHPAKFQSDRRSNQPTKTREFLKNANDKRRESPEDTRLPVNYARGNRSPVICSSQSARFPSNALVFHLEMARLGSFLGKRSTLFSRILCIINFLKGSSKVSSVGNMAFS